MAKTGLMLIYALAVYLMCPQAGYQIGTVGILAELILSVKP